MVSPQFTLDDIRRHPKFPFDAWQTDDISFLMLELYWAELVRVILGDEMVNYTALWDTERDGNPILTITNQTARRGLRLIMLENEEKKPPYPEKTGPDAFYCLHPFMNNTRLPDGETPVVELVMCVSIDDRYTSYFEYLLRLHCCDYVSVEQMEEAIVVYEDKFSMRDPTADLSEDE
jgi:hypothetical protein